MRTIWFIRHGESESNVGLPTSDPVSIELTEHGLEQAKHIALSFTEQPSLIITSSYLRTKQTALPTIRRFPDIRHEEWPVHEFTFLALHNKERTTIYDRRPMVQKFWHRNDPYYVAGEGAESFAGFMERVRDMIERIKHLEESFIAIFSHEQFIRGVLWLLLLGSAEVSCDIARFKSFLSAFSMPNGSILKVQLHERNEVWFSNFVSYHLPAP